MSERVRDIEEEKKIAFMLCVYTSDIVHLMKFYLRVHSEIEWYEWRERMYEILERV
jgi:hypothetical protein